MKKILLLFSSLFFVYTSFGQKICGSDQKLEQMLNTDPAFAQRLAEMEAKWMEYVHSKTNNASKPVLEGADTVFEIPIVVHVIHTGGAIGTNYNRSDADILAWIDYTNDMFEGTASGYLSPSAGGGRIPIRLVLAKRDPSCNPTTGIVRVDGSGISGYTANGLNADLSSGADEADLRALSRWDANSYYNIYIVNKIDGEDGFTTSGGFTAGYAYLPPVSSSVDGSFMLSYIVDTDENTFGHEIGHAFGLYHTFQGGSSTVCPPTETDCTAQGDKVCDTEPNKYTFGPCPTNSDINSCTGTNYNGVQYNVMNYGNCPNRFTPGQADRVNFITYSYRMSLVNSNGLELPPTVFYTPGAATCTTPSVGDPGNPYNMGPCNISLGSINKMSGGYTADGDLFYIDNTTLSCPNFEYHTNLTLGDTVPVSVSTVLNSQYIKVYIDYNNDNAFNETTELVVSTGSVAPGTSVNNIIIPSSGVVTGTPVRMRVIADFSPISSSCSALDYGQAEDFAITFNPDPLAVQLIDFATNNKDCNTSVSFQVTDANEVNYFEIERSVDGKNYSSLAKINSIKGQTDYQYLDQTAPLGFSFYRLKMLDNAGRISYSKIVRTQNTCESNWQLFPNPSNGKLTISCPSRTSNELIVKLIDITGKTLKTLTIQLESGISSFDFSIAEFPSGVYVVELADGNFVSRKQVVKK